MIAQFLSDWNFYDVDEGKNTWGKQVDEQQQQQQQQKFLKSLRDFNI
jgi:hypothetical protein